MIKTRLGVNIDHVATIRNARGEIYPDPLRAAILAEKSGANSITVHLREDRRHIKDHDLKSIKRRLRIPLNLEMAPTKEMVKIAIKHKPDFVCLVPEKRNEITTEGGLNLIKNEKFLREVIKLMKKNKIRVSLFIDPKVSDVKLAKYLGADSVELHTGKYCGLFNKKKNTKLAFNNLKKSAGYARQIGMDVHAGHGLTYNSMHNISKIKYISEFNIGHFIISEALFFGLVKSIKNFKKIINSQK